MKAAEWYNETYKPSVPVTASDIQLDDMVIVGGGKQTVEDFISNGWSSYDGREQAYYYIYNGDELISGNQLVDPTELSEIRVAVTVNDSTVIWSIPRSDLEIMPPKDHIIELYLKESTSPPDRLLHPEEGGQRGQHQDPVRRPVHHLH